jgi:hypothetical protein
MFTNNCSYNDDDHGPIAPALRRCGAAARRQKDARRRGAALRPGREGRARFRTRGTLEGFFCVHVSVGWCGVGFVRHAHATHTRTRAHRRRRRGGDASSARAVPRARGICLNQAQAMPQARARARLISGVRRVGGTSMERRRRRATP